MHTAGLIDLQVNGYAGVDFNDTALTAAALDHALHAMLRAGVTTCLPTLITAPEAVLAARFAALDRAVAQQPAGAADGARLPPGGAVPEPRAGLCRVPSAGRHGRRPIPRCWSASPPACGRPILLLTLAPEQTGRPWR